ncbi:MAG: sulfatase [Planctomycetes bacterium]|nr:sulfatase [Planctomycetota bacterium]
MRTLLACVLAVGSAAILPAQQPLSGSRPNILFVFSDDHAAHAISAYGSRVNTTPHIDRLATGGVRFANNFCGNSLCGPSRATVLTGLHSHRNGFMRNGNTFDGAQTTMPKLLQGAGYQTAMIGKWHLESDPTGFDHWMVLPGQGQYYNPDFLTKDGKVRLEGHVTDLTTELAVKWLEARDKQKPFLLMCQHKAPHRSWLPAPAELGLYRDGDLPEPATLFDDYAGRAEPVRHQEMTVARHLSLHYDLCVPPTAAERAGASALDRDWDVLWRRMTEPQRQAWEHAFAAENAAFRAGRPAGEDLVRWQYQRYMKNYLRCVAGVDRSVGTLLDWLDRHPDVKANTLVVYSSDQGFFLGDHGFYDKRWMYEESLRMPLLLAWPGRIAAGREIAALTQNIDFAPTFLDLAGVPLPAGLHGRSLVPLLEGKVPQDWRSAIYYHFYESQAVHQVAAHYGVRTERYKLIRYYEPQWDCQELFDLQQDPEELRNVAGDPAYAEVRAGLERRLAELRRQYGDGTGEVGGQAFPIQAGIARVERRGDAVTLWANTVGSYLLQAGDRPGNTTFTTTLAPLPGRPQQNGFLLASGGDGRRELVRAGIEFQARRLVIVAPGAMRAVAEAKVDWDGRSPVELSVTFDLERHRVVAAALGQRIEAELPAGWDRLLAWGYGASNAETVFGGLQVR